MGFISLRTWILALIFIINLVRPDLVLAGVNASSAMLPLPEPRPQPATLELEVEVPLPAGPQARIFHLHPTNAASVVEKPTSTLPLILLLFFLLTIIA